MPDQNQGASIEAERACLLVKELNRIAMSLAADLVAGADYTFQGHDYLDREFVMERVVRWFTEWDATSAERAALLEAARRTPAAQVGAGELPLLPEIGNLIPDEMQRDIHNMMQAYARAAIEADRAQQAQYKQWYDAVTDACVVAGELPWDENDARGSLAKLIAWHEEIALDPAVSERAAQLAAKGQGNSNSAEFDGIKNAAPASAQPAVKLTRDDSGMCEVSLEIDGSWVPVIRDNGDFISHIVEPVGVRIAQQRARMAERFAKRPRTAATADFDLPAPNDEIGAQPADEILVDALRECLKLIQSEVADGGYTTAAINAAQAIATIEASQGGAQPDQRDSAAVPAEWHDLVGTLAYMEPVSSGDADGFLRHLRAKAEKLLATAPSPAAQPAKDEQEADKFCDANCTWTNHAPGCVWGQDIANNGADKQKDGAA